MVGLFSTYYKFTAAGERTLKFGERLTKFQAKRSHPLCYRVYVCMQGTVLLKDKEFVRDLEYGRRQLLTFRVSRRRREMYIGHARLRVYLSVAHRIPLLLRVPGCNLGCPLCALLGGFAIDARVSVLWQHGAEREMSASACTRSMPGC